MQLFNFENMPLAVVGMACRLPGADSLEEFWRLLLDGRSAISEIPSDRLNPELYFDPRKGVEGRSYTRLGGIVPVRPFDPALCPMLDEIHETVDPSAAIMLEVAATACRDAHLDPFAMPSSNMGVYIGHARSSALASDLIYSTRIRELANYLQAIQSFDSWTAKVRDQVARKLITRVRSQNPSRRADGLPDVTGNALARVIAEALGLHGPYQVVDAACASGLYATSVAARALHAQDIDVAIVGGASYNNWLSIVLFSRAQALSATGSFPFDSRADGFISSDGYGALIIKRLRDAISCGDRIYGLISGIGASSDGRGRSLWAPRKEGQIAAFERAYNGKLDPAGLQYIEAHGTSTQIGDAIEVESMTEVLRGRLPGGCKIPIASVKANIGHTVETAGIAGLIKTLLAMQHGVVPPAINFERPNARIDFESSPFFVPTKAMEWPSLGPGQHKLAAVNSFGIGGLNVHAALEEYVDSHKTQVFLSESQNGSSRMPDESVAIVGMGAIFAGARTIDAFRRLLEAGDTAITSVPLDRWDKRLYCSERKDGGFRSPTELGGFNSNFAYEWQRHKIPPKEIQTADPLHYMLLDAADQAIQDAGYSDKPFDRKRTSVIVGTIFGSDFFSELSLALRLPEVTVDLRKSLAECGILGETADEVITEFQSEFTKRNSTMQDTTGSFTSSTLASFIARTLDLMGGAFTCDSGEASSLTALSAARDQLLAGDCDVVLCAGAQRHMDIDNYEWFGLRQLLSSGAEPEAGKFVLGEGVGLVMLKRLSDARRDNDRVHGVFRRVGIATDTRSAEQARQLASQRALAGREPGPSPPMPPVSRTVPLIGHTLGASGMASLIESAFALEKHPLASGRVVESQSFSGLVCQVIVEPAVAAQVKSTESEAWRVVRMSGASLPDLVDRVARARPVAASLFEAAPLSRFAPGDTFRLAIACESADSLAQKLSAAESLLLSGNRCAQEEQGIFLGANCEFGDNRKRRVAVLFPGQGSQYAGMLRDLVAVSPAAAAKQRELDSIMQRLGHPSFSEIAWRHDDSLATDVWTAQISLFLADTILFSALTEIGVRPDVIAGHSYGEYPALLAAGVFTMEQGIRITHARCQLIATNQSCGGILMATSSGPEEVLRLLAGINGLVTIANYNAPDQTVFGGDEFAVTELARRLADEGFNSRLLPIPRAFHTPMMAAVKEPFRLMLDGEPLLPPSIPFLSSVANHYVGDPFDIRDNLVRHFTEPVLYADLVRRLVDDGACLLIEAGPRQVLTRLHRRILSPEAPVTMLAADNPKRPALEQLTRICAALDSLGASLESPASQLRDTAPHATVLSRIHKPIVHFDATERRRSALRSGPASLAPEPAATEATSFSAPPADEMESFLIGFIRENTGYPPEVVQLDADLEADLGIDSLKKTQLFAELKERFHIQIQSTTRLALDDYPTLRHVLQFLKTGIQLPTSIGVSAPEPRAVRVPVRVMSRFVLRPREVPLPPKGPDPVWNGAAVVMGQNAIANALRAHLALAGVEMANLFDCGGAEATADEFERLYRKRPILHLFLTQACDPDTPETIRPNELGPMSPFLICQRWTSLLTQDRLLSQATLVGTSRLGGDFGFADGISGSETAVISGLLKSIRQEFQTLCVKSIDSPQGEPADAVAAGVFAELAGRTPEVEVGYVRGRRYLVRAVPRPAAAHGGDIEPGGVWVVTGGARGVTAVVARELGRRYGLKMFLLGSTPLDAASPDWLGFSPAALNDRRLEVSQAAKAQCRNPAVCWTAIEKGLEVHRNLRALGELGVDATYVTCDVADRAALARALEEIRISAGPIRGVIHGAGVESACRYENKQFSTVRATLVTKAGAAAALIELTEKDPIGWFLTFGSVNGRFGGLGQTDYALASDILPKLVRRLRSTRPECRAVNFDWPAWSETGMSVRPESRLALETAGFAFMPPLEGVEHLLDEIRAGAPENEVLILDEARSIDQDGIMPTAAEFAAWANALPCVARMPLVEGLKEIGPARLVAEVRLHPVADPFLNEHQYNGSPVLPAVIGLEALAEAASLFANQRVSVLRDIEIAAMLRFSGSKFRIAEVIASPLENGIALELRSSLFNRDGLLVDPNRVSLTGVAEPAPPSDLAFPPFAEPCGTWHEMTYPSREESARDNFVVHGERFRALKQFLFQDGEAWGRVVAPDPASVGGSRPNGWIIPAVALDSCLVLCAVHAHLVLDGKQLPTRFDAVHIGRLPYQGEVCTAHATFRERHEDKTCYDFALYAESGEPLLSVEGHWAALLPEREA